MIPGPSFARGALILALIMAATLAHADTGFTVQVAADSSAAPGGRRSAEELTELPRVVDMRGWQTGVVRADRLQHASLSFAISAGVGAVTRRAEVGAGTAFALGFGKELLDDHFDTGDLVADALGAALAALVVASITRGVRP